jgi:hypothetical protein
MAFNSRDGQARLAAVAFYRQAGGNNEGCDGFFQYIPLTGELQEWTLDSNSHWKMKSLGRVKYEWKDGNALELEVLKGVQE